MEDREDAIILATAYREACMRRVVDTACAFVDAYADAVVSKEWDALMQAVRQWRDWK